MSTVESRIDLQISLDHAIGNGASKQYGTLSKVTLKLLAHKQSSPNPYRLESLCCNDGHHTVNHQSLGASEDMVDVCESGAGVLSPMSGLTMVKY